MQQFGQVLALKIASETANGRIRMVQRPEAVRILDQAVPPLRQFSPNRPRATALMLLGVVLDLIGLRLLKGRVKMPPGPVLSPALG